MVQVYLSKIEKILSNNELEKFYEIVQEAGIKKDEDVKKIDERMLEAFIRILVEREPSRDVRVKIVNALKELLSEAENPLAHKFSKRTPIDALPPDTRKNNFIEIYRGYRLEEVINEARRCLACRDPRCVRACPIHFGIPAAFRLIAQGKIDTVYRMALSYYPCFGTMGRICVRFCENACIMNEIGVEPLSIRASHRAVIEYADKNQVKLNPKPPTGRRVAIIGSGPAGINAAYHLALMGHSVTIYEAEDKIGGVLRLHIPEFRLPAEIVEDEVSILEKLGVRFELGKRVGRDISIAELAEKYDAVFISIGANKPKKMNIPGEDLQGVVQALPFLYKVKKGEIQKISGRVWVVGGGDVAMDSARTALRLGASEVKIIYRRSRTEMPADIEQIRDAEAEGIEIMVLATPVEFIGENGVVKKMRCIRMRLGEPGPDGRRKPEPIPGSEFEVEADYVILAVGQDPGIDFLKPEDGIEITRWGTIKVDENLATTRRGFYAGGDAVRGPSTAIEALADGKKAAESIHAYLQSLPG